MRFRIGIVVILILFTGCLSSMSQPHNASIDAYQIKEEPKGNVVQFNNTTVQSIDPLRRAVINASNSGEEGWAKVTEKEYDKTLQAMQKLPHDEDGYVYIHYQGEIYQVIMKSDD